MECPRSLVHFYTVSHYKSRKDFFDMKYSHGQHRLVKPPWASQGKGRSKGISHLSTEHVLNVGKLNRIAP